MLVHVPGWQEVSPDVDRLVVHLEAAEDAVQRGAPWMTVPRDDAVLPEHLRTNQTFREVHTVQKSADRWGERCTTATTTLIKVTYWGFVLAITIPGYSSIYYCKQSDILPLF